MGVLNPEELLAPGVGSVRCQAAKTVFEILVDLLTLPIGLRTGRRTADPYQTQHRPVETGDVVHHQLGGLTGEGKLG